MADNYQSSDQIKTVVNRQLGANIFETTLYITSLTLVGSSGYWEGFAELDLATLNLNTLVPEFEVTMYTYTRVNGVDPGTYIYYNSHDKLPLTKIDTDGVVEEYARPYVYYESSGGIKDGVTTGTSKLIIQYMLLGGFSPGVSKRFDIKIKGSDAITA